MITGCVTIFSDFFRFLRWQKMATARASVADVRPWRQLGQPRKDLSRPRPVEQMSFSAVLPPTVVAIIFPHTKWLKKITDYRGTADWSFGDGLCRTLYRNPIRAINFAGTFDCLFLWIPLSGFHRSFLCIYSIPCSKRVKRDRKTKSNAPPTTPTKTILSLLNLSPLETRLKLKLLVHTFRCIHNKASSLLCAQYQVRSPTHSTQRTTRAQTYTSLIIPRVSKSAGAKSPAFFSTLLWNELPSDLRSLSSEHSFRQKLMVYLDSL